MQHSWAPLRLLLPSLLRWVLICCLHAPLPARCAPHPTFRAKLFNATLDGLRQRQQSWSIANRDVREHVRRAVVRRVMEKYVDFLSKNG